MRDPCEPTCGGARAICVTNERRRFGSRADAAQRWTLTLGDGGQLMLVDERPGKRSGSAWSRPTSATRSSSAPARLCPTAGLYGREAVMHGAQEVRRERYAVGIPFHDYQG